MDLILPHLPDSKVKERIALSKTLGPDTTTIHAVNVLGNGSAISAQDTVPFTLWCAAQHLNDFEAALWLTASGLGDIDTTCAIVGGIVASYVGVYRLPEGWLQRRETLPSWPFYENRTIGKN
jgi:ADP-ribosylglycohydrolase